MPKTTFKKRTLYPLFIPALILAGCGGDGGSQTSSAQPSIQVLSSDPAYVTGGDALLSIALPAGVPASDAVIKLNGSIVTSQLNYDSKSGALRGLLTGLQNGVNQVEASIKGAGSTSLQLKNHPRSGPIFSGPQQKPWTCLTVEGGLGMPQDEQCDTSTKLEFFYKSKASGTFLSYDPEHPPSNTDIAMATTDQNVSVPYIVRQETGIMNRVMYKLAVLFDPAKPWTAFSPQSAWNHKLYIPLMGGFGKHYDSGIIKATPVTGPVGAQDAVLNDMALKRGFAVARTAFFQPATHTDPTRAAESLLILKEHVIKNYGHIRYTFSSGASGGSFTQSQLANSYPGLLQGIIPMANFVDYWSATDSESHDCSIIRPYFSKFQALWADPAQRLAVEGNYSDANCTIFSTLFTASLVADGNGASGVAADATYNAASNPGGVRQTWQDYQVNYLGRRTPDVWTTAEKAAGFGFARSPRDNVGVQYGLRALAQGQISTEQFVHLNENVGGLDIDFKRIPTRTIQDKGVAAAMYKTSNFNDTAYLDTVPIIAVRLPDPDPVPSHEVIHSFIYRDRLEKMHGRSDNYVLWIIPGYELTQQHELSFAAMDRWLGAIEADTSSDALAAKVVKNKPADLASGCWKPEDAGDVRLGNEIRDIKQCTDTWYKVSDIPRTVAAMGSRDATFITKCQLKPLAKTDYGATFTEEQWARLQAAFPNGVCDWSKADAGLQRSVPWLDFSAGADGVPMQAPGPLPHF